MTALPVRTRRAHAFAVPVSAVVGNALAYLLLLLAARVLDHDRYGSFVALMTVMVVGTIPSVALQAVTARRVARGEDTAGLVPVAVLAAVGCAAVPAGAAAPLTTFLHIDSVPAMLWLALSLAPLTLGGPLVGTVQGAERLVAFGALSLLQAAGRFGGALVPLVVARTEAAALAGAALGSVLATAVSWAVVRRAGLALPVRRAGLRSVLRETAHALHGYAAILVLTSLDVLLARHVVSAGQAAQYAAGSVVTKAVTWLPQSIGLLVFARMTAHADHLRIARRTLAVVAGFGLAAAAGSAVLGGVVTAVVGGNFPGLESSAWIFALLGTGLAVLQFTVVVGLAVQNSRRLLVLWAAMGGEVGVVVVCGRGAAATTVAAAMAAVVLTAAVVAGWLAAGAPRPRRRVA